jgi:hypothetical protein
MIHKTLTPLTAAELELAYAVLNHALAHPCHKCLELEALTDKVNFFRLKAKGIQEQNPAKTFPSRKTKTISGTGELAQGTSSTNVAEIDIPLPSATLIDKLNQVGIRTEKKRKYNKSKLNPPNNYNA